MPSVGSPTLDQLKVLLDVAETGSFTAAARRRGRATSAVTYVIDQLEGQLGLALFDRAGRRRPELTEAGRALLHDARAVVHGVEALTARVVGLRSGLEAEVNLAVDVLFPSARLVEALQAFQAAFPTIPLRLHVEALGGVNQLVLDGTATLGLAGPLSRDAQRIERQAVGAVRLLPVAAPFHPLARTGRRLTAGEARQHIQLVLTDRSQLTRGRDFGVLALSTWRLGDLGAKHALLLAGIGWGSMPEPIVAGDIEAGRLIVLDLPDLPFEDYRFNAIHRIDQPPGIATRWLIDRFAQQVSGQNTPAHG